MSWLARTLVSLIAWGLFYAAGIIAIGTVFGVETGPLWVALFFGMVTVHLRIAWENR